ncbi:MAG: SH3 domain-containing protein [Endomicrobiaceae bacterium]|nr:SH3 domain-containing protein [Endomicrobiaceae bacterium]
MKFIKILFCFISILLFQSLYAQESKTDNSFTFFIDGDETDTTNSSDFPIDETEHNSNTKFIPNGPTIIKNVTRNMETPGYWISKIKNPDKEILTKKQITEKNKELFKDLIYLNNIEDFKEDIKTSSLRKQQKQIYKMFYYRKYIDNSFKVISKEYINDIYDNIKIPKTKTLKAKYAISVNYSDIRLLPSDTNFLYDETTYDIDRAQVASLDTGTPLVALVSTKDKKWTYVVTYASEGWVKTKDLAFTTKETFFDWINEQNFVIVTNSKADIYINKEMTKYYDYVRMSTKLPILETINKDIICVKIPKATNKGNLIFEKAYMYSSDTNKGYLKYTQRNVLQQAFKHINSPYSWGGYDGEQDCSTFIRQVFGCFGLILPRNSLAQIKSGNKQIDLKKNLSDEQKSKEIIAKTTPAISLLYLPGHIMLYIGNENNNTPYIIHAIWGTEHTINQKEKSISFINRVIVSSLHIGENTSKDSLLRRIQKVNTITLRK